MAEASSRFESGKRIAMLVALPMDVWDRIRSEARDLGVGPSKVIEPVLLQAFGRAPIDDPGADEPVRGEVP